MWLLEEAPLRSPSLLNLTTLITTMHHASLTGITYNNNLDQ